MDKQSLVDRRIALCVDLLNRSDCPTCGRRLHDHTEQDMADHQPGWWPIRERLRMECERDTALIHGNQ